MKIQCLETGPATYMDDQAKCGHYPGIQKLFDKELKPCPFCGKSARLRRVKVKYHNSKAWRVECDSYEQNGCQYGCGAKGKLVFEDHYGKHDETVAIDIVETALEAIDVWNLREGQQKWV